MARVTWDNPGVVGRAVLLHVGVLPVQGNFTTGNFALTAGFTALP